MHRMFRILNIKCDIIKDIIDIPKLPAYTGRSIIWKF